MIKDDIKKGLAVCAGDSCDNCSYYKFHNCYDKLKLDARSLIIEQEKKIEKLKAENKQLKTECALLDDELRIARQDTIDVLNKLKEKIVERMGDREYMGVKYKQGVFSESEIDEMIAEVQNAEDKS